VVRGYLGVQPQDVDEQLAKSMELPNTSGALISQVVPDGPAAKAGLQVGDFITKIDDKPVANEYELRHTVAAIAPGQKAKVEYYRQGKPQTTEVELGKMPEQMAAAQGTPVESTVAGKFGLKLDALTPTATQRLRLPESIHGVLITSVQPLSEAYDKGLRPGMVVTDINGQPVQSVGDANKILGSEQAAKGVNIRVVGPGGGSQFMFIGPMRH